MDIFSGDPKLYLTADGSDLLFNGGQPVMETGKANVAIIALFTSEGWCGNAFIHSENDKIGSGFESSLKNPITLKSLALISDAAEKALTKAGLTVVDVDVTNPITNRINVSILARDDTGQEYSFVFNYGPIAPTSESQSGGGQMEGALTFGGSVLTFLGKQLTFNP
jgi:hypothetical protein